ncbi:MULTISPECIES: hypothetical protein [unclassified Streptomyces]|uniref:hypothetical protein n=1 Tax=unclassified Streptomyces TaxID=2593676 RepID=UPI0035D77C54
MIRRRHRILLVATAGATILSGSGLAASTFIKSPQQVAAEKAAPAADVLTARVEKRILTENVVTRGQVAVSQKIKVKPLEPFNAEAVRSVITRVKVKPKGEVKEGNVLMEISGRPLFAFKGTFPMYRNLAPGCTGEDVLQLQKGLRAQGFEVAADEAGTYGPGTASAVDRYYRHIGYSTVSAAADEPGDGEPTGGAEVPTAGSGASGGPIVPASELFFISSFPARVDTLTAAVGAETADELLTVSAGELIVRGTISPQQAGLVRSGQRVQILSEATGSAVPGTVSSVAAASESAEGPPADGATADAPAPVAEPGLSIKPATPLPAGLAGQEVLLTIEAATSGKAVLVVPESAITSQVNARTVVTVLDRAGERRRVEVRTGMTGDGYVEVTPVNGTLPVASQVVIGDLDTRRGE